MSYRPDIDGLRAVSILAVVAYHIGLSGVPGGFVGVDVFFVISGYLIIGQIRAGLATGTFSVAEFYARRALRILPPFLLVLAVSIVAAAVLLVTRDQFRDFGKEALSAAFMLSNFRFYTQGGYFDVSADVKPLLHTWTLSVEEQFYIVAPILIVGLVALSRRWRRNVLLFAALVLALLSFLGCLIDGASGTSRAAFFLAPFRAWEFIIGGLIGAVSLAPMRRLPMALWQAAGVAGLAAILAAIVLIDGEAGYPSWPALLPVLGAALVILAGQAAPGNIVARFLSAAPMVAIGLVSYAWYLWHWPLLAFSRIANFDERWLPLDLALGAGVGLALAIATYFWLEVPVRNWRRTHDISSFPYRIVMRGVAACASVALIAFIVCGSGYLVTKNALAKSYETAGGPEDESCALGETDPPAKCLTGNVGVIVGDSHAREAHGTFAWHLKQAADARLVSLAYSGCAPLYLDKRDADRHEQKFCDPTGKGVDWLFERIAPAWRFSILHARWNARFEHALKEDPDYYASKLRAALAFYAGDGRRLLLIGPVPEFARRAPSCLARVDRYGMSHDRCGATRAEVEARRAPVMAILKRVAAEFESVRFVDPIDQFCDAEMCRPFAGDHILYRDDDHVSPAGAEKIYAAFAEDFLWAASAPPPQTDAPGRPLIAIDAIRGRSTLVE